MIKVGELKKDFVYYQFHFFKKSNIEFEDWLTITAPKKWNLQQKKITKEEQEEIVKTFDGNRILIFEQNIYILKDNPINKIMQWHLGKIVLSEKEKKEQMKKELISRKVYERRNK